MASLPIRWMLVRAYCQATEDEARVGQALETAVAGGTPSRERQTGQFGNPVLVLSRRLEVAADLRATWARWADAGILEALRTELDARVDGEGILHVRLDKQAASEGRLILLRDADAIDVRIKLKAYPANPAEISRVAHGLLAEAV